MKVSGNFENGDPLVLVVDDDPRARAAFEDALRGAGCTAIMASDGHEACAVLRTCVPDAIVLDILLPGGIDGMRIFTEARRDPRLREIPVVLLSAKARSRDEMLARALGAAAFVARPVDPVALASSVRSMCERPALTLV